MIRYPRGNITFLCATLLAPGDDQQAEQLRTAVAAQRGVIFYDSGGRLYAAFSATLPALEAALEAHEGLLDVKPEDSDSTGVTIVLHAGLGYERDGMYFGAALNRVLSMLEAAHPGQILLSPTAHQAIHKQLPPSVKLVDIGEYRLKDLFRTVRLYQVVVPGMPAAFPPLQSLDLRPHNLPIQDSPLIGREHEVLDICALLRQPSMRLLTLLGSSGTGKTRLALQVAVELIDDFADGVYFVALAPVNDPNLLIPMIAQVLKVKEQSGQSLLETVSAYVQNKQLLLVLDNFEQLWAAAPTILEFLSKTPQLKVLVTSQVSLELKHEYVFAVPPLAMPENTRQMSIDDLSQIPAIALFIERARDVQPSFALTELMAPAVSELCTRLEGLPLAIELVAAQSRRYFPGDMLVLLQNRLSVARTIRRGNTREDTLRPVLDWICEVLGPDVAGFFARLGVFAGGCTSESAKAICNPQNDLTIKVDDSLQMLLENHLLLREELKEGHVRYTMLDAIHDYAHQRLARRREATRLHNAHASYYTTLAETAEPLLKGPEQKQWLVRLEDEHHNLRRALRWSIEKNPDQALQLAAALARFWFIHGHFSEGRSWVQEALAAGENAPLAIRARAFHALGLLAYAQSDYDQSVSAYESSLTLRRELGDTGGIAMLLNNLGIIAKLRGEDTQAASLYEECVRLSREVGDTWGLANALTNLGGVAFDTGDFDQAAMYYQECVGLREQLGDTWGLCLMLLSLGSVAYHQGDHLHAEKLLHDALRLAEEIEDKAMRAHILEVMAQTRIAQGDLAAARSLLLESMQIHHDLGAAYTLVSSLESFAHLRIAEGQVHDAPRLLGAAALLREELGTPATFVEKRRISNINTSVLARISPADYDIAWQDGRTMPLDDLINHLLHSTAA